jgi:hypothetical protein
MNARTLRGCAVLALLCFALPRAEAVTINFDGTGSTQNGSGTVHFEIRNNEEIGDSRLQLSDGALLFFYEWYLDWLMIGFELADGTWTATHTAHRTVPLRTSPSNGTTTNTKTLALGNFTAVIDFSSNDFLVTGDVLWKFGAGAPTIATVPDGPIHLWYVGAVFGGLVHFHRRRRLINEPGRR